MKTIEITPHYTKGMPIDVIAFSLERAEAVAGALSVLHNNLEGEAVFEPDAHRVYMLATIIEDHVRVAREALNALIDEGLDRISK